MIKLLFLVLCGVSAFAQATTSLRTYNCKVGPTAASASPLIPVNFPVVVAGVVVTVPLCVTLGPGITLNTATTPPQLEAVAPVAPVQVPRQALQKIPLSTFPATTPLSSTVDVTLPNTPAAGTHIVAILRSSRVGGNTVEVVAPGATNARTLRIELPDYRPFTADDVLTVLYWTFDAP